ncbi:MAG: hypothetical protein IJR63_06475 [Synergistaceae bacterium]|nr:hypothetical protein [Synergistaceae bacterium]
MLTVRIYLRLFVNFSLETVRLPEEIAGRKVILSSENDVDPSVLKPLEARLY